MADNSPAEIVPELQDCLVAASKAFADGDQRAGQTYIGEALTMLAAARKGEPPAGNSARLPSGWRIERSETYLLIETPEGMLGTPLPVDQAPQAFNLRMFAAVGCALADIAAAPKAGDGWGGA